MGSCCSSDMGPGGSQLGMLNFHYFDIYGRGEPGRMMLAHGKVPHENTRVSQANWGNLKMKEPYNGSALPVLIAHKGKAMTQSKAIYRLIARKHGYYPKDEEMAFINDWIVDTYYDFYDGGMAEPTFKKLGGAPQAEF